MGVVNTKSTEISNSDALPKVPNTNLTQGGMLREDVATLEVATTDTNTSTYRFVRLPSSARISNILIAHDAISGFADGSIGVYYPAVGAPPGVTAGAVVDADCFNGTTATDFTTARRQWADLTHEVTAGSGGFDVDEVRKKLWEIAGLSADPGCNLDIVITGNDVTTNGGGTISMLVRWVA